MIAKLYMEWALQLQTRGKYENIRLVDMAFDEDKDFVTFTQDALNLIKSTDPRRYRTVIREVRFIVNSHITVGGYYQRTIRRVSVNFRMYKVDRSQPDYNLRLAAYACMLVHEATHGRIFSFGIPYNDDTWERCERLCRSEEKRFVSRIQLENADPANLVSELDRDYYLSIRKMSMRAKLTAIIDVIRKFSSQ